MNVLLMADVTLDDVVNILDVVNLVQAILGLEELNDNQICNADINVDGIINILDVGWYRSSPF